MARSEAIELPDFLDAVASGHAQRPALSFGSRTWSFEELRASVAGAAPILARAARLGRIGILSTNRPGFVIAVHAAARLGVPFVPLNWRQTPAELAWQFDDAAISTLLVDERHRDLAERSRDPTSITVIPIEELESAPPPATIEAAPPIRLDRDAAVIYTSGTTGRPKGARITYGNLWFSAVSSSLRLGHQHDDVWLAVLPLFHIGGLSILYRGVIGASRVILQERFDPGLALEGIDAGATLVSLVPAMLQRLLSLRGDAPWPGSLRCILLGGAPAPAALLEACLDRQIPVAPTYGLTESTSQLTTLHPRDLRRKLGSSGLPLPTAEVRIIDGDRPVTGGEVGEIAFRGPTRFAGYLHHDPIDDASSGGWWKTGDVGYLDEDGYLFVVDRRSDLIVSGGENVYPAEVERVLLEHPSVRDAGVVGVRDDVWGARPVAAVVWDGDPAAAERALLDHCRERLASYKVPDHVVPMADLPRSPSGKLLRATLRDHLLVRREIGA